MGGGELYAAALPLADELVLTEIDAVFPGADAFFPPFDRHAFELVASESHQGTDGTSFSFVTYSRTR
jgi:dihydrofolate reductase